MPLRRSLAAVTLLFLVVCPRLSAQTTYASVTGTVTDKLSSSAVVTGAAVVATNVETSVATTDRDRTSEGVYTRGAVAGRAGGALTEHHGTPGFREFLVAPDLVLVTRDLRRESTRCWRWASLDASVQVTGGAARAQVRHAAHQRRAHCRAASHAAAERPRSLFVSSPLTPMLSLRKAASYTMAGSRYNQSQFSLDGTSMSDGVGESPIGPLANYIESFKEVKIDIASNSAESGSLGPGHHHLEIGHEPV